MPPANHIPNDPTILRPTRQAERNRSGFVLIIALSLTALVVLLLLSISTLTQVEIRASENVITRLKAKQNALLGLQIALGTLQKTTGLDQRTTANADIIIPDTITVASTSTGNEIEGDLNTYWKANRNRHWTGSWRNGKTSNFNPEQPSAHNPTPILEGWLVSGHLNSPNEIHPTNNINGLTTSSTPGDVFYDSNGNAYTILVKNSAGVETADDLDRVVTAPVVEIENTNSGNDGYAWWVGDEGTKAKVNLVAPYADDSSDLATRKRQAIAQRISIETLASDASGQISSDGLGMYPINAPTLERVASQQQWTNLKDDNTWTDSTQEYYHDLTLWSHGVLADMQNGGLKRDLSYILGQPTQTNFRTAMNAAYSVDILDNLSVYNRIITDDASAYGEIPSNFEDPTNGMLRLSATWEQLWSFYNMGNLFSDSPSGVFQTNSVSGELEAIPTLHRSTQHGIVPIMTGIKVFYKIDVLAVTDSGADKIWDLRVSAIPQVTIANPYNVPLAPADYQFNYDGKLDSIGLWFGTYSGSDPEYSSSSDQLEATLKMRNRHFILQSEGMAAGEAQIFSLDITQPGYNGASESIPVNTRSVADNASSKPRYLMVNEGFDPVTSLSWTQSVTIPATQTHVALFTNSDQTLEAYLYLDDSSLTGSQRHIHNIYGLPTSAGGDRKGFVTEPTDSVGQKLGGGIILTLYDAPTDDEPEALLPQQAPFMQANYRSFFARYQGSLGGKHLLEWGYTHFKNYASADGDTSFNKFLQANLMFRPDVTLPEDLNTVRWGLLNFGEGPSQSQAPASIGGPGTSSLVGFNNYLYDIPRPDHKISSLGQLQHFNTTGHVNGTWWRSGIYESTATTSGWQSNYSISNSYPHPYVSRHLLAESTSETSRNYDGSYIFNQILWDRFYFSTYPQSGSFDFSTDTLDNSRLVPFREESEVTYDNTEAFRGNGAAEESANSRKAAENLLIDGAFNINSTSIDAWKAVISSLRDVEIGSETAPENLTAPFARTLFQAGTAAGSAAGNTENAWNGIRNLTPNEIQELAEEIVLQVRLRGPFLSMAEFVNRRLVRREDDTQYGLGLSGALQAAIDKTVNKVTNLAEDYQTTSRVNSEFRMLDSDYVLDAGVAGFPGYLLQGDFLSKLGATLAGRSDTFTIRSYGDTRDPLTQEVIGRAWCEAVVQRIPDYVNPNSDLPTDDATDPTNIQFGRSYQIVNFRWLEPEEI